MVKKSTHSVRGCNQRRGCDHTDPAMRNKQAERSCPGTEAAAPQLRARSYANPPLPERCRTGGGRGARGEGVSRKKITYSNFIFIRLVENKVRGTVGRALVFTSKTPQTRFIDGSKKSSPLSSIDKTQRGR